VRRFAQEVAAGGWLLTAFGAAGALVLSGGCAPIWTGTEMPAVYSWTECYPVEDELARDLGILVDYCADPAWSGHHWGVVAYYAGSPREQYLAVAWGIWYPPGKRPDLNWIRVALRLEGGEMFMGAAGARPQFNCRHHDRGECVSLAVQLRGSNGRVAERVFSARRQ